MNITSLLRFLVRTNAHQAKSTFSQFGASVRAALDSGATSAERATAAMNAFRQSTEAVKKLLWGLGITFIGFEVVNMIRKWSAEVINFQKEFANVTTLFNTTVYNAGAMRKELLALSGTLGGASELARGLYQTLSSGVDPAKSVKFVGEAAKFATAALTDTFTAVDILTTIINAYGMKAEDAAMISDKLFKTIELGKITGEQLSGSLGRVVTIASQAGISLDELLGSLAALTKVGLSSDEAVTAIRQLLVTFLKPAESAKKAAKDLGGSFKLTLEYLKDRGLLGAMSDLSDLTGDNASQMSQMFRNVRALTAALPLSTAALGEFESISGKVALSLGSVNTAFEKQISTVGKQAEALWTNISKVFINVSGEMDTTVSVLKWVNSTLEEHGEIITKTVGYLGDFVLTLAILWGAKGLGALGLALVGGAGRLAAFVTVMMNGIVQGAAFTQILKGSTMQLGGFANTLRNISTILSTNIAGLGITLGALLLPLAAGIGAVVVAQRELNDEFEEFDNETVESGIAASAEAFKRLAETLGLSGSGLAEFRQRILDAIPEGDSFQKILEANSESISKLLRWFSDGDITVEAFKDRLVEIVESGSRAKTQSDQLADALKTLQMASRGGAVNLKLLKEAYDEFNRAKEKAPEELANQLSKMGISVRDLEKYLGGARGLIQDLKADFESLKKAKIKVPEVDPELAKEVDKLKERFFDATEGSGAFLAAIEELGGSAERDSQLLNVFENDIRKLAEAQAAGAPKIDGYAQKIVDMYVAQQKNNEATKEFNKHQKEVDTFYERYIKATQGADSFTEAIDKLVSKKVPIETLVRTFETEVRKLSDAQKEGTASLTENAQALVDYYDAMKDAEDFQEKFAATSKQTEGALEDLHKTIASALSPAIRDNGIAIANHMIEVIRSRDSSISYADAVRQAISQIKSLDKTMQDNNVTAISTIQTTDTLKNSLYGVTTVLTNEKGQVIGEYFEWWSEVLKEFGVNADVSLGHLERRLSQLAVGAEAGGVSAREFGQAWLYYIEQVADQYGRLNDVQTAMLEQMVFSTDATLKTKALAVWQKYIENIKLLYGENLPQDIAEANGRISKEMARLKMAEIWKDQMSTIRNDLAEGLADIIVEWKGFFNTMKDIAKSFAKSILRVFFESLFNPIMSGISALFSGGSFSGGFNQVGGFSGIGGFFGKIGNFLGIGSGAAGGIGNLVKYGAAGIGGIGTALGLGGAAATTATAGGTAAFLASGAAGPAVYGAAAGGLSGISAAGSLTAAELYAGVSVETGTTVAGAGGLTGSMNAMWTWIAANPWTLAVAGGVLGAIALYKIFKKSPQEKALNELNRDFGGISGTQSELNSFIQNVLGLQLKNVQDVRKETGTLFSLQQAFGPGATASDQQAFIRAMSNFQVSSAVGKGALGEGVSGTYINEGKDIVFDLSEAAKKAVEDGNVKELAEQLKLILGGSDTFTTLVPQFDKLIDSLLDVNSAEAQAAEQVELMELALEGLRAQPDLLAKSFEQLTANMQTLRDAGATDEEVLKILGDSLNETIAAAEELGVEVPEAFQALVDSLPSQAFLEGKSIWEDFVKSGQNLEDKLIGLGTALLETKGEAEAQSIAWKFLGDDIVTLANEYESVGQVLPEVIRMSLEYAEANNLIERNAEGAWEAVGKLGQSLSEQGFSEGVKIWEDLKDRGEILNGTLQGLGTELLKVNNVADAQLYTWRLLGADVIDLANEYENVGRTLPSVVQASLEYAIANGLIARNTKGAWEAVGELTDVLAEGKAVWTDILDSGTDLNNMLVGLGTQLLETHDVASAQSLTWKLLGDSVIDLANQYEELGLELPEVVRLSLEYAKANGLVERSTEGAWKAADKLSKSIVALGKTLNFVGDANDAFLEGWNAFENRLASADTSFANLYGQVQSFYSYLSSQGVSDLEIQKSAWKLFGDEIISAYNEFVTLNEDVPYYLSQMISYGEGLGEVELGLNGIAYAAEGAIDALDRLSQAQIRGSSSATEFLGSASSLGAEIIAFGKKILEAKGYYDPLTDTLSGTAEQIKGVQIDVWNRYKDQIIETAKAFDEFGLTIPESIQNMINFAIQAGLATRAMFKFTEAFEPRTDWDIPIVRGIDKVRDSFEKALTPIEKFLQFEEDILRRQELGELAAFANTPSFTDIGTLNSIVQQVMDLSSGNAQALIDEAIKQFGTDIVFGAGELLRRREADSFADALDKVLQIRDDSIGAINRDTSIDARTDVNATIYVSLLDGADADHAADTIAEKLIRLIETRSPLGEKLANVLIKYL